MQPISCVPTNPETPLPDRTCDAASDAIKRRLAALLSGYAPPAWGIVEPPSHAPGRLMVKGERKPLGLIIIVIGAALSAVGLGILFLPMTESDALGGSLRCGSAVNPDEAALREYRDLQLNRLREAVEGMGRNLGENPPSSIDITPLPPTGVALDRIDPLAHESLEQRCSNSLSTTRSASAILIAVGLLAMIVGLAVWERRVRDFARRTTEGARLPTWMGTSPEWVQAALVTFSGLTGALAGIVSGWWRAVSIAATAGLVIFAVLISIARSAEAARRDKQLARLKADHREETQNLLGNELHTLVQLTAEAVATEDRGARREAARAARVALVHAAAHLVGTMGTRANLFRLSADGRTMTLDPGHFAGRGIRSTRVFAAGQKTFDLAMVEQGRLVKSVKDELTEEERGVPYETFMTYPVSIGPERIHGVLTVDSLTTGDLDEVRDMPLMALLSALIAVTYECEKYDNAVI